MINGCCYFDYILLEEEMVLQVGRGKNADHTETTVLQLDGGMRQSIAIIKNENNDNKYYYQLWFQTQASCHLIFRSNLRGSHEYCTHFTDKKAETENAYCTGQKYKPWFRIV